MWQQRINHWTRRTRCFLYLHGRWRAREKGIQTWILLCRGRFRVLFYVHNMSQYAISQLRIVRSGLHLVTYLDVGNFCDKSTETTLHEIRVQVFPRFSDSSKQAKPIRIVNLWIGLACWNPYIWGNLFKTSCKVALVTKVSHIFWWRHNNGKQSASACEYWCDVICDVPY